MTAPAELVAEARKFAVNGGVGAGTAEFLNELADALEAALGGIVRARAEALEEAAGEAEQTLYVNRAGLQNSDANNHGLVTVHGWLRSRIPAEAGVGMTDLDRGIENWREWAREYGIDAKTIRFHTATYKEASVAVCDAWHCHRPENHTGAHHDKSGGFA